MFFLFDENIPQKLADGISTIISSDNNCKIKARVDHIVSMGHKGASDPKVIEIAGKNNAIIITFDRDFKHLKSYYSLYRENSVGVVLLKLGKKDSNYWGIVRLLVSKWEDLKEKLHKEPKPFAYIVTSHGVQRQEL